MIKVDDVVYAMFRAPDLDRMENFLVDFGLMRAHRTESHLYMRTCGRDQYAHITELGDPGSTPAASIPFGCYLPVLTRFRRRCRMGPSPLQFSNPTLLIKS